MMLDAYENQKRRHPMKFQVTREDIRDGTRKDARRCPIARAIKRMCVDAVIVTVSGNEIGIRRFESFHVYDSLHSRQVSYFMLFQPAVVNEFMTRFDKGEPVEPFEFEFPGFDPRCLKENPDATADYTVAH